MRTSWNFCTVYLSALICLLSITSVMSDIKTIVKGNERFGKNLFTTLSGKYENLIMSPLSAHAVLSMAYAGADDSTATAFKDVLFLKDSTSAANEYQELMTKIKNMPNTVTLKLANKVYIQDKFKLKPEFDGLMKTKYFSEAQNLNFADNAKSAEIINQWVEDQTNKKIKNLIAEDMLNEMTRLVLVNAIYFKGKWAKQFKKENTKKRPFYLLDGKETMVDMMHISDKFNYAENSDLDCKILEMQYQNSDISMVIFLPNKHDGIKNLEKGIVDFDFSSYDKYMSLIEVDVQLPKFKIESTIPMKETLEAMGLGIIFSDDANFSKISANGEGMKVSDVIQKAFIEVNEEGAEAAAATATTYMLMSARPQYLFNVNHPFIAALLLKKNNEKYPLFLNVLKRLG